MNPKIIPTTSFIIENDKIRISRYSSKNFFHSEVVLGTF